MSVNGGYGVMLQVPERVLQEVISTFEEMNSERLQISRRISLDFPRYAAEENLQLVVRLHSVRVSLLKERTLRLQWNIAVLALLDSVLEPTGTITSGDPVPHLNITLSGSFVVDVGGIFRTINGKTALYLDLVNLQVSSLSFGTADSNVNASADFLSFLSSLARREAIRLLAGLDSIPVSWEISAQIPILGNVGVPVSLAFKVVSAGDNRALAILLRVMNESVAWDQVTCALEVPSDVGVFVSLDLMNYACSLLCQSLEGMRVIPGSSGIKGDLIFHDAHIRVIPSAFVIDEIKVQSRLLKTVEETVEKVLCTAIDPCHAICNRVFETVERIVQIDQLAHASGKFYPLVQAGEIRVDAHEVDADLSLLVKAVVFTASTALLPLGSLVSVVLMVIGKPFLDRTITKFADNQSLDAVIRAPLGGSGKTVTATARNITWPAGTFAIMTNLTLS
jgi:hypothetical protein